MAKSAVTRYEISFIPKGTMQTAIRLINDRFKHPFEVFNRRELQLTLHCAPINAFQTISKVFEEDYSGDIKLREQRYVGEEWKTVREIDYYGAEDYLRWWLSLSEKKAG